MEDGTTSGQIEESLYDFGFPEHMMEKVARAARDKLQAGSGKSSEQLAPAVIVERCLSALANEGARLLVCGIAASYADIDVVCVHAFGWPRHSGGPMFHSNKVA